MKFKLITILMLTISTNLMARMTSLEIINEGLSKIHNGDHAVALLEDKADFIGFDIISTEDPMDEFVIPADIEIKFTKNPYFSDKKVKKIVKRLNKKCQKFLNRINKNNKYYCSDVFVYSGDVSDPTKEGRYHKAMGQQGFDFIESKDKVSHPAPTRLKLASNNEPYANYDVYVIGVMEK